MNNEFGTERSETDVTREPTATGIRDYGNDLRWIIDYTVVDQSGDRVGTVDAVWEDNTGQPAYIAVRTGWLGLGRAHVVPAEAAEINESSRKIRLPYTTDQVKNAPAYDSQADITSEAEREIWDYYQPIGHMKTRPSYLSDEPREMPRTEIDRPSGARTEVGAEHARIEGERTIPLREEEAHIGKREVETGGVRLRKVVRTERVNEPVDLKREEIVIERVPGGTAAEAKAAGQEFKEEEIYVPLRREEAVVAKESHVAEQVRVGKKETHEHQEVSADVRKEDVEVSEDEAGRESSRITGDRTRGGASRYVPKERSRPE